MLPSLCTVKVGYLRLTPILRLAPSGLLIMHDYLGLYWEEVERAVD